MSTRDVYLRSWRHLSGHALLAAVLRQNDLRVAVSSSFGAESAVLLDQVSQIDPSVPVLFVDTGYLFAETLAYKDALVRHLGLTDVRVLAPSRPLVDDMDPHGMLHRDDPDRCCQIRKVMPYAYAAADFDILITGRKRHHGDGRSTLPSIEFDGVHIKVNPLALMSHEEIEGAFDARGLPRHPLTRAGYPSIGCAPCTVKVCPTKGVRSGRWSGRNKSECGIHTAMHHHFINPSSV